MIKLFIFINMASALLWFSIAFGDEDEAASCPSGMSYVENQSSNGLLSMGCLEFKGGRELRRGRWVVRAREGQILQELTYNENGELHGSVVKYGSDGQVREELSYSNGKLHGLRKRWDIKGNPDGVECFVDNERQRLNECNKAEGDKKSGRSLAAVGSGK